MDDGAVYRPALEMAPTAGLSVQTTLCCDVPVTVAANCWFWAGARVALPGATLTATTGSGVSVTVALAAFVGSALLVAETVTVCWLVIEAGEVYRPVAEMAPTAGLSVQATPCCDVPVTVAIN